MIWIRVAASKDIFFQLFSQSNAPFSMFHRLRRADLEYVFHCTLAFQADFVLEQRPNSG